MCCGSAAWKREEVPDHKFDFIDVRDYHTNGLWTRTRYGFLFLLIIKSIAVYIADIYTATTLLAFNKFNGSIYSEVENNPDNTVAVPIKYGKWIFFGCILFSFLLLAYEAHKSRAIIRSRDISYAYTNVMANNYYSLRSYDHFCFFSQINNSTKKKDEIAFFIFFTFKGWKRLIVADAPRQAINGLTLYGLIEVSGYSTNVQDYYRGNVITGIMLLTMIFTLVVFTGSAILLIIASVMYLPLLCYMKGNLKEFCCHKIDKRVTELIQVKKKERVAKQAAIARAEAKGDFSHLMNKEGIIVGQKMMQPTLPDVDVDLILNEKSISPSTARQKARGGQPVGFGPYAGHNASGEDFGSQAHLVLNQGPAGGIGGHSVQNSIDDYGGAAPSLPPTVHSSPDAYPLYYKGAAAAAAGGINAGMGMGMPSEPSATAGLMAQLGPIGTSPQLFAQRSAGAPSVAGSSRYANGYNRNNNFHYNEDAASSSYHVLDPYGRSRMTPGSGAAGHHADLGGSYPIKGSTSTQQLRSFDRHGQYDRTGPASSQGHPSQPSSRPWPDTSGDDTILAPSSTGDEGDSNVGYGYAYAEDGDVDNLRNYTNGDPAGVRHSREQTKAYVGDLSSYAPYNNNNSSNDSGGQQKLRGYHYSMHEEDVAAIEDVYESYHHLSFVSGGGGSGGGGGGGGEGAAGMEDEEYGGWTEKLQDGGELYSTGGARGSRGFRTRTATLSTNDRDESASQLSSRSQQYLQGQDAQRQGGRSHDTQLPSRKGSYDDDGYRFDRGSELQQQHRRQQSRQATYHSNHRTGLTSHDPPPNTNTNATTTTNAYTNANPPQASHRNPPTTITSSSTSFERRGGGGGGGEREWDGGEEDDQPSYPHLQHQHHYYAFSNHNINNDAQPPPPSYDLYSAHH